MERFVLWGGTFGNLQNRAIVGQAREGGKARYLLRRVFLPYSTMKEVYPVLQKHPWLTPVYQVVRWCRLVFTPDAKLTAQKMKTNVARSQDDITATEDLLHYLGL